MILGLDLAPRKCGWAAGTGAQTPVAGGFALPQCGRDFGRLLEEMHGGIVYLLDHWSPTVVIIEEPILPSGGGAAVMGSLEQRRAQMCMGPHVEWLCRRRGIICQEENPRKVKSALCGNSKAEKKDMVNMAIKLGIRLPDTLSEGREDAADAVGCWLIGVENHARQYLVEWDKRRYKARGAML